jgi:non-homologous end joining protein Ku
MEDEGDEAEDAEEEGNIAEILMAQAAKDMDEKKMKDLFDAQLKKKLILKKKSDKEYEAYWSKQKGESRFQDTVHLKKFLLF